ncbi:putative zinc-binding oxidoreductase ToxD [Cercophora newfieldiana]|uniref:Zinc-binding oxidoreductase ToxD n=1 Tax=Cercophora newfieldiana TaxID=92897 RepID=A0AA40CKX6_9PEZI|nr:putative zinc-binding oxidoreductase ToxD [Cercophora newfieldiana]
MKAIKMTGPRAAEIQEVPIPALRDDYVLVKVKAVALNPTDWKHIDFISATGCTVGCDYAGIIEEVGPQVTGWKKGDRIAGFTHGSNSIQPEDGCFAEYVVAKGGIGTRIPPSMTFEDASSLGVGITTVGQALYQSLGLPLPESGTNSGLPILIYGGSTATGTIAIQFARLSGCSQIITTCSPANFDLVKSLGATAAFDYRDPDCASKIREYTNDALTLALDCVSDEKSAEISSNAISSKGGAVCYLLSGRRHKREDVENKFILAYTAMGEYFEFSIRGKVEYPAQLEDLEFGRKFWQLAERLLAEGKVKPHPVEVNLGGGGLEGVFEGLQAMREGNVSGKKLVYSLEG